MYDISQLSTVNDQMDILKIVNNMVRSAGETQAPVTCDDFDKLLDHIKNIISDSIETKQELIKLKG